MKAILLRACLILVLGFVGFVVFALIWPVKALNLITPSSQYSLEKNISYSEKTQNKLDIYTPKKPRAGTPVILFVHGGSWTSGNKEMYKFFGDSFASEGFDVVVANYRLYPDVQNYTDFLKDTAEATAFTARKFNYRPIVLIGHSAGAYNVLMMGMDERYLQAQNMNVCETISGVVSLAGPTGVFPFKSASAVALFPNRGAGEETPIGHSGAVFPQIFLMNGGKDVEVLPENAQGLAAKIQEAGGSVKAQIYPELDHVDAIKVLSRYFVKGSTLKKDIVTFIEGLPQENYCGR